MQPLRVQRLVIEALPAHSQVVLDELLTLALQYQILFARVILCPSAAHERDEHIEADHIDEEHQEHEYACGESDGVVLLEVG